MLDSGHLMNLGDLEAIILIFKVDFKVVILFFWTHPTDPLSLFNKTKRKQVKLES